MRRLIMFAAILLTVVSCSMPQIPIIPEAQADRDDAAKYELQFQIGKDTTDVVWGRAQAWIATHASMKIQVATEYVIETYNPYDYYQFGFSVTKTPSPMGFAVSVVCVSYHSSDIEYRDYMAHSLARYMQIGR